MIAKTLISSTILILVLFSEQQINIKAKFNKKQVLNQDSLIKWNASQKLNWSDFEGKPDSLSEYKAKTFIIVKFNSVSQNKNFIVINIPCYFIKNLSWTKNKIDKKLLNHEKLHFDIAELISRKIRKELGSYKSKNINETSTFIDQVTKKFYYVELDSINKSYDKETNHGTISEKQREWDLKIENELKILKKYSKIQVSIAR